MAKRAPATQSPAPRLYLCIDATGDDSALARVLADALSAGDVAAVLLRAPGRDERALTALAKALAPTVQQRGAALILDGYPHLAARAGADGAHLTGVEALEDAIATLKPDRIAGAGGLQSRHDAMIAAEKGADYVMFGEPDGAGRRPGFEAVLERVSWWAEVFETPCVGYAGSLDEVAAIARAGAEFVAIGDFVWNHAGGAAAGIAAAERRLQSLEHV